MRNKFNAKKTTVFGITFDSQAEANRYMMLRAWQKDGVIRDLQLQVPYELVPGQHTHAGKKVQAVTYIADFAYRKAPSWELVVEDVKGYKGGAAYSVFSLKKKLMLYVHGIEVREIG